MKKQRRIQDELTPGQQKRFIKVVCCLFGLSFCWVLFAPGAGLVALIQKKAELYQAKDAYSQLYDENEKLRADIRRLNEDPQFLEKVARKRGFLARGEMVFDFSKPNGKN